jgi:hypothetical protein
MTTNSPRIYVYKITFYEVLHYYYGVHKEKFFDEYYMGSPKTHKDFWELYTPKKEYIEFFEYSDEGYTEARIFEDSLIAPVLNDEFCLNEHYGGFYSLETSRKVGKMTYERGIGIHGRSKEKRVEDARNAGQKCFEKKAGIHGFSVEQISENGKKGGQKVFELGIGVCGQSKEKMSENGKKGGLLGGKIGGQRTYKLGVGVHGRSKEQMTEDGKKGGKVGGPKGAEAQHKQKWQCIITGYVSTPCGLTGYQKAQGIDTSNRVRFYGTMYWKIVFEDGSEIIIDKSLYEWAKESEYSYSSLKRLIYGKIKNYRDIIKVVLITSNTEPPHKVAQDPSQPTISPL